MAGEVGQAGDRWLASDGGVGSVVIVEVEPAGRAVAGGFVTVEPGVGPAVGQGAVEAFDLAVGLGSVGPGPFVGDAEVGAGVAPGVGAVGGAVVGQHAFDGDAVFGEPGDGAVQDADAVAAFSSPQISA